MEDLEKVLGIGEERNTTPYNLDMKEKVMSFANNSSTGDNLAETILAIFAYALLVLGILSGIIAGFAIASEGYNNEFYGFLAFIGISIPSVLSWAVCMVVVNISNNIRQIKYKVQEHLK